jgi:hypothetical protein
MFGLIKIARDLAAMPAKTEATKDAQAKRNASNVDALTKGMRALLLSKD